MQNLKKFQAKIFTDCGPKEIYSDCHSYCPPSCDNYYKIFEYCVTACFSGCACIEGFVRDYNTTEEECVKPEDCTIRNYILTF